MSTKILMLITYTAVLAGCGQHATVTPPSVIEVHASSQTVADAMHKAIWKLARTEPTPEGGMKSDISHEAQGWEDRRANGSAKRNYALVKIHFTDEKGKRISVEQVSATGIPTLIFVNDLVALNAISQALAEEGVAIK